MVQKTERRRVTGDGRSLLEQFDYEEDGIATTASYATILKIDATKLTNGSIITKEDGGTNSIFVRILGSNKITEPTDDTDDSWVEILAETSIIAGAIRKDAYTNAYKWIWLQAKNNSGVGTVKSWHRGTNG